MAGLLYARSLPVNDHVTVHIPLVGEIIECEDEYFDIVSTIIATPYDMMVQLDDVGIDFTTINDFELFCLTLPSIQKLNTELVFDGLELSGFRPAVSHNTQEVVLLNEANGAVIDRIAHSQIAQALRTILFIPRDVKKPANDEAKAFMIERARKKQQRRLRQKKNKPESQIENAIISLVNTAEFPYNYQTVRDITIYQFYSSLHQISHKVKFDNTMIGYYAGTVKLEDIDPEDRTWLRL